MTIPCPNFICDPTGFNDFLPVIVVTGVFVIVLFMIRIIIDFITENKVKASKKLNRKK